MWPTTDPSAVSVSAGRIRTPIRGVAVRRLVARFKPRICEPGLTRACGGDELRFAWLATTAAGPARHTPCNPRRLEVRDSALIPTNRSRLTHAPARILCFTRTHLSGSGCDR